MKYKFFLGLFVLLCAFGSCKKEAKDAIDYDQTFTIVNPLTNYDYAINIIEVAGTGSSEDDLVFFMFGTYILEDKSKDDSKVDKVLEALTQIEHTQNIILVSIVDSSNSYRDYTSTPRLAYDIDFSDFSYPGGEIAIFSQFVIQDVDSLLISNNVYDSNTPKGIIADNIKGWAASYFFCMHNDFFDNYIIIDPALHWDEHRFFVYEQTYRPHNIESTAIIFLGDLANNDLGDGAAIELFATILVEEYPNVEVNHNIYDGEAGWTDTRDNNRAYDGNVLLGLKFILE